jgi:hypothetical protein
MLQMAQFLVNHATLSISKNDMGVEIRDLRTHYTNTNTVFYILLSNILILLKKML